MGVAVVVFSAVSHASADDLTWHTSYPTALQEARETGKPLLVAFRCIP